MPSTKVGKIAARIAGATGTGSLGAAAAALTRFGPTHAVPPTAWVALAALAAVTAVVADLALVLDYRRARLEIAARAAEARARAELETIRLDMYRTLVEKSAGEPGSAAHFRDLFLADALHLAVEQGVKPADRTHGQLYGSRGGRTAAPDPDSRH